MDKQYSDKLLKIVDRSIELAPTDPKLYLNKARILFSMDQKEQGFKFLKKALELKPDFVDAQDELTKWTEATAFGKAR